MKAHEAQGDCVPVTKISDMARKRRRNESQKSENAQSNNNNNHHHNLHFVHDSSGHGSDNLSLESGGSQNSSPGKRARNLSGRNNNNSYQDLSHLSPQQIGKIQTQQAIEELEKNDQQFVAAHGFYGIPPAHPVNNNHINPVVTQMPPIGPPPPVVPQYNAFETGNNPMFYQMHHPQYIEQQTPDNNGGGGGASYGNSSTPINPQ